MEFTLAARNVSCSRTLGADITQIVHLTTGFEPASLNILLGKQGCGNNLLLRLLGLLEKPDSGEIIIQGESATAWDEMQCAEVRRRNFGFVFDAPFLLPSFNVVENVAMPLFKLAAIPPDKAQNRTDKVLDFVGMSEYAELCAAELPHWAALRVSLARALITDPAALFVENVDKELRDDELIRFLELLAAARRVYGCCILATGLCRDLASFGGRALEFEEGRVIRDWSPAGLLS
jgi:lipoprotein-releasing system ATP-binding protein